MNSLITYIVDSFTDEPFKGNPAGVCLTEGEIESDLMLSIAKELGFSETAFVTRKGKEDFDIRFFSPIMEIPLCGHATLASSKVVFERNPELKLLHFRNIQNIDLEIRQVQNQIIMKFPIYHTQSDEAPIELLEALGIQKTKNIEYNKETNILLIEIDDSQILRQLKPDYEILKKSHDSIKGVLVTSESQQKDMILNHVISGLGVEQMKIP